MAKIKKLERTGVKQIAKLEVRSNSDPTNPMSNSFITIDGTINHNCNGPHVPLVVVD